MNMNCALPLVAEALTIARDFYDTLASVRAGKRPDGVVTQCGKDREQRNRQRPTRAFPLNQ